MGAGSLPPFGIDLKNKSNGINKFRWAYFFFVHNLATLPKFV